MQLLLFIQFSYVFVAGAERNYSSEKWMKTIVAAVVAAGLFGTGTAIKDKEPVIGTVMQGAAIGTLAGGALGAARRVSRQGCGLLGGGTVPRRG